MDAQAFEKLVRRLEGDARRNPRLYKFKVAALSTLGYAYIFFCALLISPLFLHPILWTVGLPLMYFLVRALWVRVQPPSGRPLQSEEAPALFREIRKITAALHCPQFHAVLVDDSFNAGVYQQPRFGIFGGNRNTLVIGLPLLLGLSPVQFRAVLAHEYAHLFGAHGRFSGKIYRMRLRWIQLMKSLEERRPKGAGLFQRFFNWYAPYFDAYAYAFCRQNEFDADQFAADWVGPNHLADELVTSAIKDIYIGRKFWTQIWLHADEQAERVDSPYTQMQTELRGEMPGEFAKESLQRVLVEETGVADSHPCLTDRLAPFHEQARLPAALEVTAADFYLGAAQNSLIAHFDAEWHQSAEVQENWSKRYQQTQENKRRLAELEEKQKIESLNGDEEWELGNLLEMLRGADEAIPIFQACLAKNIAHASANYSYGRILLSRCDETGIAYLERVMQKDPASIPDACALICDFLVAQNRPGETKRFEEIARRRAALEQNAHEERAVFRYDRECLPHDLTDAEVEQVAKELSAFQEIAVAYLVRQNMTFLPEQPVYAVALVWKNWRWFRSEADLIRHIAQTVHAPRGTFWFISVHSNREYRNRLAAIPFSKIYSRTLASRIRDAWRKPHKGA